MVVIWEWQGSRLRLRYLLCLKSLLVLLLSWVSLIIMEGLLRLTFQGLLTVIPILLLINRGILVVGVLVCRRVASFWSTTSIRLVIWLTSFTNFHDRWWRINTKDFLSSLLIFLLLLIRLEVRWRKMLKHSFPLNMYLRWSNCWRLRELSSIIFVLRCCCPTRSILKT